MCLLLPLIFFSKKTPRSREGTYPLPLSLPGMGNGGKLSKAACKSWGRSGRIHVIYHLHLFFVLLFWLSFRLHDASASILSSLFHNQQPSSLCPSILHPLSISILHHPSFPSVSLTTCSVSCTLTPCPFVLFLSLSSQHPSITPCLPIPTLSTWHSVPCDSVSHFLHSPYYPVCHITLSPVIYKSFQLVVIP